MKTPPLITLLSRVLAVALVLSPVVRAAGDTPAPAADPAESRTMFPIDPKVRELGFFKGFAWGFPGMRGDYENPESLESMRLARQTGATWLCISFSAAVEDKSSSDIRWGERNPAMVSDDEVRHAIRQAKSLGFKVLLKPMIDPLSGQWRGHMKFADDQGWATFFENYHAFILHYAEIAAETGCEMFNLGCEMNSSVVPRFDGQWRSLIEKVRKVYPGVITYNGNHDDIHKMTWWDAVDVISLSAYFPAGKGPDSTVEEMMESWAPIRAHLAELAHKYRKPVFFIEIGLMSARGRSRSPGTWDAAAEFSGEEQARYYEAALRSMWDQPWFQGYFWWKWDAVLSRPETSSMNTKRATVVGRNGFRILGKPAEALVREWYAKPRPVQGK